MRYASPYCYQSLGLVVIAKNLLEFQLIGSWSSIGFIYEFFNKNGNVFAIDKARNLGLHLKESRCNGLQLSKLRCMNLQLQRLRVYSFVIIKFKVHGLVVARIEVHGFAIFGVKVHVVVVVKAKGVGEAKGVKCVEP